MQRISQLKQRPSRLSRRLLLSAIRLLLAQKSAPDKALSFIPQQMRRRIGRRRIEISTEFLILQ
jgi:hypothetical protein